MAHQRKVSYMLARNTEDLEKRLKMQLEELDISHRDTNTKTKENEWNRDRDCRCSPDTCGSQHPSFPDNLAADDVLSTKPSQPSTEMKETNPDKPETKLTIHTVLF